MSHPEPEIANFRADYASRGDFCEVLERELDQLYLLAFFLTANHSQAEECFAATAGEASKEQAVFKDWTLSWIRRSLIKNAIRTVSPGSASGSEKRDSWSQQSPASADDGIDALTSLPPLQRFVFVMSILERYSLWECSALLSCSTNKVAQARMQALRRLPGPAGLFPRVEPASRFAELPA